MDLKELFKENKNSINNNKNNNNNNNKGEFAGKSAFSKIPNSDNLMKEIGILILNRDISYKTAFNMLKQEYPDILKNVNTVVAFSNYLKGKGFVGKKNYESYYSNVSKTEFAKTKRKVINKYVIEDLLNNEEYFNLLIEKLFDNKLFLGKLNEFIKKQ